MRIAETKTGLMSAKIRFWKLFTGMVPTLTIMENSSLCLFWKAFTAGTEGHSAEGDVLLTFGEKVHPLPFGGCWRQW
ncbi:hypothetical protein [Angelakisella massiliensis]|uniref:hypothetical protein n=1 Tax=Angelakisella massiliensis TaxID=1871018 RepID=UPI0023A7DEA2|nr:hypothetical protein [Angelakisella massiliensis]